MKSRYTPPIKIPDEQLEDIHFNGMDGRLLHLKSDKPKKFVMIGGQHTSHERMYSLAQLVNEHGEVYLPDIPGFGGMDSFYSIGMQPTWDNYADYLYTFLKSHRINKNIWFFANSFGSQVMTRMLQKYPDSHKWVDETIAFVGFCSGEDFKVSKWFKFWSYALIYPASTKTGVNIIAPLAFNRLSMKAMLSVFSKTKAKMQNDDDNLKKDMVDMEAYLWDMNDHRTHASTAITMYKDDLRKHSKKKLPFTLYNIITEEDQYFDNDSVKKAFLEIYEDYKTFSLNSHVHAPSLIADKEDVRKMISDETIEFMSS